MSGLNKLIHEIHRRSLWQVLGIYLAGSWVSLDVFATFVEQLFLPSWVFRGALILLVLGLPIVLATAFFQRGIRSKPAEAAKGLRGLFTWRRALTGGVLVFALLGLGTAGYVASRALGFGPAATLVSRGEIAERERIVLADFESAPQDSGLARAVTLLFRVDLSQSPAMRIVEPVQIVETLRRMERDLQASLDVSLATEVSLREGFKAVLAGEVSRIGTAYVITARLLTSDSGEQLLADREIAENSDAIISAVERLSKRLRERIGEPLRSIRRTPPLARVTTPSLDALKVYSEAERAFARDDYDRAIPLLEAAIAIDPTFAMAYRKLHSALYNSHRDPARMAETNERSFELRTRLAERERLKIEGSYYMSGHNDKAIAAYEALLERYPDDYGGTHNLTSIYLVEGEFTRAEELARRAIALSDSVLSFGYSFALAAQVAQGEFEEARSTLERMAEMLPDDPKVHEERSRLASARRDYAAAEEAIRPLVEREWEAYWVEGVGQEHLAGLEVVRGRLANGESHLREAMAIVAQHGAATEVQRYAASLALFRLLASADTAAALNVVQESLEQFPLEPIEDLWTAVDVLQLYAVAGQPFRARALLERLEADFAQELRDGDENVETLLARSRGFVALGEGKPEVAAAQLRRGARATPHLCYGLCVLPWIARSFEQAGQPDSAIAVYEEYLNVPMLYRGWWDAFYLASTYDRLGRLFDGRVDLERAAEYYTKLVELWAEADEELQPRVRAAQARLEEILAERG